jgi:hypothetical protein
MVQRIEGEPAGLLALPDEMLDAAIALLPEDDEFAVALTCTKMREAVKLAVTSSGRKKRRAQITSTSTGSVFGSLAKVRWAVSCGLRVKDLLIRKARDHDCPLEHLCWLLDLLPGAAARLCGLELGSRRAVQLGGALEANATLTKLDLRNNKISIQGAIGLGKALKVNKNLTELNLRSNQIGHGRPRRGPQGQRDADHAHPRLEPDRRFRRDRPRQGTRGQHPVESINTSQSGTVRQLTGRQSAVRLTSLWTRLLGTFGHCGHFAHVAVGTRALQTGSS